MGEEVKVGGRQDGAELVRSAGLISGLTFVSRLLGLVREQVFAASFGTGLYSDAFQIAFRIPNLLRDLFAEGALSAAFVPTYTRILTREGRAEAMRLVNRLLTLLAAGLGVLVLIGMAVAPQIVALLAPGYGAIPGKAQITVTLTRIMLPFLPIVSFAAVAMGMLNAERRFRAPALAPATFNLVAILWAAVLWLGGFGPKAVAVGWSVGVILGGLAQVATQVPELWRCGWRLRLKWAPGHPAIRRIMRLMTPATAGLAAVQVNILISSVFASHDPSAVSTLNFAFRILYLPVGIFGVAVGTIATTGLSHSAAQGDMQGLGETLRRALRMVAFLTVPATVGLMTLTVPIVRLIYQRGRFTAADTDATAMSLMLYALGLLAYTGVKVLAPAFYVLGTPRVPLYGSLAAVGGHLGLILLAYPWLGFQAVALGTSFGSLLNASLLVAVLQRRLGLLRGHGLARGLLRMSLAAAVMGLATAGASAWLESVVGSVGLLAHATIALLPIAAGVGVYVAVARVLRVPEVQDFLDVVRGRGH